MKQHTSFFNRLAYYLFTIGLICLSFPPLVSNGQDNEDRTPITDVQQYDHNRPDSTFLVIKNHYQKALDAGDEVAQGINLSGMGEICYHQGHYAKALKYYLEAKKLFEKNRRPDLLADNYNKLGILYYYNKDDANARLSYDKAMKQYTALHNQQGIAATLGQMGHLLEKKQLYDSAIYYQQQALLAYQSINDKTGMARIYDNLGSIQEDLAHYDSAMFFFNTALAIYKQSGNEIASIEVINNIGDIYRKTGNLPKALEQSFLALKLSQEYNELYQLSSAYRDIAKTYYLLQKNDSAFLYAEISRQYLLEIYSKEGNKQMAFLQVLDDMESKNNEIKGLQQEKRLTVTLTLAILVIVILLIIASLLIISRQRIKLRSEQETNQQKDKVLETQKKLMDTNLKASLMEEEKLKAELRNKQLEREKLDIELKNRAYEENQLKQQIEIKSKELSTHVLHVIQKNQLLDGLKMQLAEIVNDEKRDQKKQLRQLMQQINQNFNNDSNWDGFSTAFEQIHQSFFNNLNQLFPGLTATDLKLISLLKMNMSPVDMATMLGISQDSLRVARYRLRKKLNLEQGEHLIAFLQSL